MLFKIRDIRESRFYQDALQDGIEVERARQLQQKIRSVARLAALGLDANQIAETLELDVELVRRELAKNVS